MNTISKKTAIIFSTLINNNNELSENVSDTLSDHISKLNSKSLHNCFNFNEHYLNYYLNKPVLATTFVVSADESLINNNYKMINLTSILDGKPLIYVNMYDSYIIHIDDFQLFEKLTLAEKHILSYSSCQGYFIALNSSDGIESTSTNLKKSFHIYNLNMDISNLLTKKKLKRTSTDFTRFDNVFTSFFLNYMYCQNDISISPQYNFISNDYSIYHKHVLELRSIKNNVNAFTSMSNLSYFYVPISCSVNQENDKLISIFNIPTDAHLDDAIQVAITSSSFFKIFDHMFSELLSKLHEFYMPSNLVHIAIIWVKQNPEKRLDMLYKYFKATSNGTGYGCDRSDFNPINSIFISFPYLSIPEYFEKDFGILLNTFNYSKSKFPSVKKCKFSTLISDLKKFSEKFAKGKYISVERDVKTGILVTSDIKRPVEIKLPSKVRASLEESKIESVSSNSLMISEIESTVKSPSISSSDNSDTESTKSLNLGQGLSLEDEYNNMSGSEDESDDESDSHTITASSCDDDHVKDPIDDMIDVANSGYNDYIPVIDEKPIPPCEPFDYTDDDFGYNEEDSFDFLQEKVESQTLAPEPTVGNATPIVDVKPKESILPEKEVESQSKSEDEHLEESDSQVESDFDIGFASDEYVDNTPVDLEENINTPSTSKGVESHSSDLQEKHEPQSENDSTIVDNIKKLSESPVAIRNLEHDKELDINSTDGRYSVVHNAIGDGSCFLHCIAFILNKSLNEVIQMMIDTINDNFAKINFMAKMNGFLSNAVEIDIPMIVETLNNNVFCENIHFIMASLLLRREVVIISNDSILCDFTNSFAKSEKVYILNDNNVHFMVVKDVAENFFEKKSYYGLNEEAHRQHVISLGDPEPTSALDVCDNITKKDDEQVLETTSNENVPTEPVDTPVTSKSNDLKDEYDNLSDSDDDSDDEESYDVDVGPGDDDFGIIPDSNDDPMLNEKVDPNVESVNQEKDVEKEEEDRKTEECSDAATETSHQEEESEKKEETEEEKQEETKEDSNQKEDDEVEEKKEEEKIDDGEQKEEVEEQKEKDDEGAEKQEEEKNDVEDGGDKKEDQEEKKEDERKPESNVGEESHDVKEDNQEKQTEEPAAKTDSTKVETIAPSDEVKSEKILNEAKYYVKASKYGQKPKTLPSVELTDFMQKVVFNNMKECVLTHITARNILTSGNNSRYLADESTTDVSDEPGDSSYQPKHRPSSARREVDYYGKEIDPENPTKHLEKRKKHRRNRPRKSANLPKEMGDAAQDKTIFPKNQPKTKPVQKPEVKQTQPLGVIYEHDILPTSQLDLLNDDDAVIESITALNVKTEPTVVEKIRTHYPHNELAAINKACAQYIPKMGEKSSAEITMPDEYLKKMASVCLDQMIAMKYLNAELAEDNKRLQDLLKKEGVNSDRLTWKVKHVINGYRIDNEDMYQQIEMQKDSFRRQQEEFDYLVDTMQKLEQDNLQLQHEINQLNKKIDEINEHRYELETKLNAVERDLSEPVFVETIGVNTDYSAEYCDDREEFNNNITMGAFEVRKAYALSERDQKLTTARRVMHDRKQGIITKSKNFEISTASIIFSDHVITPEAIRDDNYMIVKDRCPCKKHHTIEQWILQGYVPMFPEGSTHSSVYICSCYVEKMNAKNAFNLVAISPACSEIFSENIAILRKYLN